MRRTKTTSAGPRKALGVFAGSQALAAFVLIWAAQAGDAAQLAGAALGCALACGLLAGALRLSAAWLVASALAPFATAAAVAGWLPGWAFLAAALGVWLLNANAMSERVPLYLSNAKTVAALVRLAQDRRPVRAADLGCGLGGPALALARALPDTRVVGYETAPLAFLVARLRAMFAGPARPEIRRTSFWNADLGQYDLVYAFLSPAPMARLGGKVLAEMKPGAVFVSNGFEIPGRPPDGEIDVGDAGATRLLVWTAPEPDAATAPPDRGSR